MSKNPDKPPSENYRKPPKEHQFKKGERSRNPHGRPKKVKKAVSEERNRNLDDRINKIVLEEAFRPVTIRQGDQELDMPAVQVIILRRFAR